MRRRDVLGNNGERPDRGKRKGVLRTRTCTCRPISKRWRLAFPVRTDKWKTVLFSQNSYEHMGEFEAFRKRGCSSIPIVSTSK